MMRSRREAGNGLISGYKKAEEVARKKVVIECEAIEMLRKYLHCHNNKLAAECATASRLLPSPDKSARGGQAQVRMVCFLLF
jgi:hypothetical protein